MDNRQWLEAIQKGTSPLVKPEEALAVTRILDNIYKPRRPIPKFVFKDGDFKCIIMIERAQSAGWRCTAIPPNLG